MRITFYLGRQVLIAMGLVVVALTCIIWLSQSLRFIELIVNRGLPLWTFLQLTVLLLPAWLTLVLPIACFAAVLFVYNRLTSDRELMVMAAAGLGPAKLARPALLVGVLTVVAGYCMTIYLQPLGYRTFKEMQFSIRHNHANTLLREGVFTTVARDVTFFVRQRRGAGELEGILVHDARDPAQTVTVIAQRGTLVMADGGLRVVMENGNRQTRDLDDGRLKLVYLDIYAVDL
ncbi:MAG: LptF/LptG family permease [Pseudomonadota bacterium]|nr:LptF/LptG family permease [Pseudomonadota bacterium]